MGSFCTDTSRTLDCALDDDVVVGCGARSERVDALVADVVLAAAVAVAVAVVVVVVVRLEAESARPG